MLLKEKLVPEKRQNISTLKCLNDPKNEVEGDRKTKFHNTATILVFSSLKCYKLVLEIRTKIVFQKNAKRESFLGVDMTSNISSINTKKNVF